MNEVVDRKSVNAVPMNEVAVPNKEIADRKNVLAAPMSVNAARNCVRAAPMNEDAVPKNKRDVRKNVNALRNFIVSLLISIISASSLAGGVRRLTRGPQWRASSAFI
jgi:hypothetical protein